MGRFGYRIRFILKISRIWIGKYVVGIWIWRGGRKY